MNRSFPALLLFVMIPALTFAQATQAKYGNDFLTTGSGSRALGMGSAHAALTADVTSAYWNVAGLAEVETPQIMYMHSERFSGIVGYDYGAAALPLKSNNGVVSISFFRQGVDNIANTLNAWDRERDQPKQDVESYITRFSAADMALLFSFATQKSEKLSYGASAKIINQKLGPFAEAWGYSLDIGAKYRADFASFGVTVHDITTMQKMWDVNESAFGDYEAQFDSLGASLPTGQNEFVLPSVKLGVAKLFPIGADFLVSAAADVDLLFENRQAYYLNLGRMSIEPHVGSEVSYKDVIAFRAGVTDFITDPVSGFSVSPTLGLGLKLSSFVLDYGFSSFAGASSDLGFTHRISLRFDI
ncbi:MAG: PorV/PorQ family protein [Gracilimonas sp.]|uniref:PorV/PorQ family protein n=1 Tax=Gracilimonas TaxID=649462 RepID=UPI001B047567|nr:PorV/PorQ family protein [Gracilimonas sp.]MBO6584907.1 PorV/PorQ family protein [Gracilimonas sp.]MBO6615822.1 PorV/PorQ family protein [Gracilimonas sp.]